MIRKLVKQMLLAQSLSALTVSLCLLIDNVMIGRFLGVDAIAAYGLANPVLLIIGALGSMLAAGIQVACSKSLGSGSQEETDKGYSSAIGLMAVVSLALTAIVLLFRSPLATAMGAGTEGGLFEQTRDYLGGFIIGAPGCMAALSLLPFLQMAGQNNLLIAAVVGMTVADVSFDLLNVLVFHGGMFGMGLASALSYYVALGIAATYFFSKKCVFTFSRKYISAKKIRELALGGIPSLMGMAASVVFVFIMNYILLGVSGKAAVAAFSVITTIGGAANCISTGTGNVALTLSGILYNEEDRTGLKELLRLLGRYAVILGLCVGALLALIAPTVVGVFMPDGGDAREMATHGLRLFALGMIPCCLNNALKCSYQGCGKMGMTELVSVLEGMALPALSAFVLSRFLGVTGAWLYFVAGECLTLLLISLYVWRRNGRAALDPQAYLLLGEDFGVSPDNLMEMDIHSLQDVTKAAEAAGEFCRDHGQSEKISNHIALCLEEMASNTVSHGFAEGKDNHLSVRVQHREHQWLLRFRDDCRAFDPVHYVPSGEEDALGIRLVMAMADDVRYTYSLNLNNLTIHLTAKS